MPPSAAPGRRTVDRRRSGNGRDAGLWLSQSDSSEASTPEVFPWYFVATLAFLAVLAMYAWLWIMEGRSVGWALLAIPVLIVATALLLGRAVRRELQFDLGGLLVTALLLRFAASYYRYDNAIDARGYHNWGVQLAESFRNFTFSVDTGGGVPGTGTVRYISGLVNVLSNSDEFAAFLIFTWIAFFGCYLLYRAFVTAVPDGDRYRYAKFLFFWPSLVLWPSSIGKESVMLLALGLGALGAARLFTRRPGGYTLVLLGIVLGYFVRPHVAMIALMALVFGLVISRGHAPASRSLTPGSIAKFAAVLVLLVASSVVASRTADYLNIESLRPASTEVKFEETRQRTGIGGSEFTPADAANPFGYPQAAFTILYRPLLFEAEDLDEFLTAFEALGLALLTVFAWRRLLSVPSQLRTNPYVALSLAFVLLFFFVFSVISNFGILARERTMVLPFAFVLLSVAVVSGVFKPSTPAARPAQPALR
jgi:hypothetical protein